MRRLLIGSSNALEVRRTMRRLRKFALGALILLGAIALVVFIAEASFHRIGSQQLAEVTARMDAEESGWRLHELEAARQAAKPPDQRNSAPLALQLHGEIPEWWNRHAASDDAPYGEVSNRTPSFCTGPEWLRSRSALTHAIACFGRRSSPSPAVTTN
jgi:hypothetical protein